MVAREKEKERIEYRSRKENCIVLQKNNKNRKRKSKRTEETN